MKTRNLIILAVAVIAVVLLRIYFHQDSSASDNPADAPSKNLLTYAHPAYSIQYPTDWIKTEDEGEIIFLSPLESSSDTFQEKLGIGPLPGNPNSLAGAFKEYVILLKKIPGITFVESSNTALAGNPAYKIIFTGKLDGVHNLKVLQVWTVKAGKYYAITYTAEIDRYADYFAAIQTMMDSLRFSTKPPLAI
ncbi:MAG TPA: PsbP-related protein [Candidatus Nanoarchaeia archaeon]|nr:PsbP-related protein [Candidatus Nanoarchaeia archaeon]